MTADFQLHDQLAADTALIADLPLSRCLLMQDARFPWIILVPRIANLRELHEVPEPVRLTLFEEIEQVSTALQQLTGAHKLNVAALGNQVPQLHIHVIARQTDDAAWPGPVWGVGTAQPYPSEQLQNFQQALRATLNPEDAVSD